MNIVNAINTNIQLREAPGVVLLLTTARHQKGIAERETAKNGCTRFWLFTFFIKYCTLIRCTTTETAVLFPIKYFCTININSITM